MTRVQHGVQFICIQAQLLDECVELRAVEEASNTEVKTIFERHHEHTVGRIKTRYHKVVFLHRAKKTTFNPEHVRQKSKVPQLHRSQNGDLSLRFSTEKCQPKVDMSSPPMARLVFLCPICLLCGPSDRLQPSAAAP